MCMVVVLCKEVFCEWFLIIFYSTFCVTKFLLSREAFFVYEDAFLMLQFVLFKYHVIYCLLHFISIWIKHVKVFILYIFCSLTSRALNLKQRNKTIMYFNHWLLMDIIYANCVTPLRPLKTSAFSYAFIQEAILVISRIEVSMEMEKSDIIKGLLNRFLDINEVTTRKGVTENRWTLSSLSYFLLLTCMMYYHFVAFLFLYHWKNIIYGKFRNE